MKKNIVVIGNGMVGHRFCEKFLELGGLESYQVVVLGEEPRPAYDRVHLSSYFEEGTTEHDLFLCESNWYSENGFDLRIGVKATNIDRDRRVVRTDFGDVLPYDQVILAMGSSCFMPPVEGIEKEGVFAYRTIEDLNDIIAYSKGAKTAAVMGGGLLGLEAAKAVLDLGLDAHVVEFAPRLMPRQLDETGAALLKTKIEELDVQVHLSKQTTEILGDGMMTGLQFAGGEVLNVDMLVVSAGIRPRDELARTSGITVGERGGIVVDDFLRTSDSDIFAIGEVALHGEMIYGLVAPGYRMADVVAANLLGDHLDFTGWDMSTKLKLMGVDVASFGEPMEKDDQDVVQILDSKGGVYKKLVVDPESNTLVGGILVGDASEYARFLHMVNSGETISGSAAGLLIGAAGGGSSDPNDLPDSMVVCSCNNVTKGEICEAIEGDGLTKPNQVKTCTKAGAGCGGCMPMVSDILTAQLKASGQTIKKVICEHFAYSRQELVEIIRLKNVRSFGELLESHGSGDGCYVCKPAVASILASTWNELIQNHDVIQDTNDQFLANIQRGGTYSVIPRILAGELTPQHLVVLGEVAEKYDLYCKITGGQRIALLGARVDQLPQIWAELVAAGFESGHAYGKALRTVKSCVGTSWCRYGVQDSTALAVRVENRYKGLRSPHKLKSAVSGCTRECAEAQSKDFGLIATEKGWNLYVCGNGGLKPRHADLLVSDVDEDTVIKYIDRFLMYYIRTADPLARTARWVEKLEGGIKHVYDVVVNDSLGIGAELERDMHALVKSYECEWANVVDSPELQKRFTHFANDDAEDTNVAFVPERGQKKTGPWIEERDLDADATDGNAIQIRVDVAPETTWWKAGKVSDFRKNSGVALKYGDTQIALFHFGTRDRWYASQNMCPHKRDMVLSRGLTGDLEGIPKVSCPMHKKQFSLESGECLSGDPFKIKTFPVKVEGDEVFIDLPKPETLMTPDCGESKPCEANAQSELVGSSVGGV